MDAPFTAEQHAQIAAEADLLYDDFVQRVADGRGLGIAEVQQVARGRVWTGADAQARGLVDELGGLQTAIRRAKVLAGLDPDKKVKVVELPGSSLRDMLRPKASSRPAAGVTELLSNAVVGSVTGMIDGAQRQLTGTTALWLGQARF